MAARFVRDEEAAGSNPATPTQVKGHSHRRKWPFPMPYSSKVQQRLRTKLPPEPLERSKRLSVRDLDLASRSRIRLRVSLMAGSSRVGQPTGRVPSTRYQV